MIELHTQPAIEKYSEKFIERLFTLANRECTLSVIQEHNLYLTTGHINIRAAFGLLDLEDKYYFIRMRRQFKRLGLKENQQKKHQSGKTQHFLIEQKQALDIINHQAKGLLVYGCAINDFRGRGASDTVNLPSYHCWKRLIERCHAPRWHERKPHYADTSMCDEWHIFSRFHQWFEDNMPTLSTPEAQDEICLSKDVFPDAKIYSPDTCFLIPKKIEHFLGSNKRKKENGMPLGVTEHKRGSSVRYLASTKINRNLSYIGWFDLMEDASYAYQKVRWNLIVILAKRYESIGVVPSKFVEACQERLSEIPDINIDKMAYLRQKIESYSQTLYLE